MLPFYRHLRAKEQTMRKQLRLVVCGLCFLASVAGVAFGDANPGDTFNKDNIDKLGELVSPGVKWCMQRGLQIKVVPYKKIEWNKEFREATEKYSSQVKLASDGRRL